MTIHLPTRLVADSRSLSFAAEVEDLPALAPIDWPAVGLPVPQVLDTPAALPQSDVVLLAWADPEWAATNHVFCASSDPLPYSQSTPGEIAGWQKDSADMRGRTRDWTYWGYFRLVQVGDARVLLYKSNTHYAYQGAQALTDLTQRLASVARPKVIISTGTAGGTNDTDHVGTVVIVNSATLYHKGQPSDDWPTYDGSWTPAPTFNPASLVPALMPIPITTAALTQLAEQFDQHEHTNYTLAQLDALGLNQPDPAPAIQNLIAGKTSLLTADSFLVGTTNDTYAAYSCIEMDDAIVAAECQNVGVQYGSVRNLSDPAQNPVLPARKEGDWGSTVYKIYGFYTSYNGALVARATIG